MRTHFAILFSVTLLVLAGNCFAQVPAVNSFSGGNPFVAIDGNSLTAGWNFTANANLTVSALGFWEPDTTQPLVQAHQVGLWTASGTLLASATVQVNSPVTGSWRYAAITPVALSAGQTYYVGSTLPALSANADEYTRVPVSGGTVVTNPLITIGTSAISADSGALTFPNNPESTYLGRFGPNLIVAPIVPPPTVPISPWALAMIATGLVAAGWLELRKRRLASSAAR